MRRSALVHKVMVRPDVIQLGAPYKEGRDAFYEGAWAFKVATAQSGVSVRSAIQKFAESSTALFERLNGRRVVNLRVVPMLVVELEDGTTEILGQPPRRTRRTK